MNTIITEDIAQIIAADLPWQKLAGKTILISGASGFLPSYLVHSIMGLNDSGRLAKPAKVIALVRSKSKAEARFINYLDRMDFRLIVQDINDLITDVDEDLHYIIHAASQASPKYYGSDPVGTLSANIFGTANLLKLAKEKRVEGFLYFSSGEVYGQVPAELARTDELNYGYIDPMNVRSCYGESKRMGENMCVSWHAQFGVPVKIVRPFHTYGPGMQLDDGRVFADFVADIVAGRDIVMKSDGSAIRAFCYLVDASIGFFTVLFKGKVAEAYNVANDQAVISIVELAIVLASLFPAKKLKVVKKESVEQADYLKSPITRNIPDVTKLQTLGWQAKYSISEGFLRTIMSFN
ncbi:MAG: NAD-dependent epimerase/dehydratase family protein [Gammaproteobacteria bacterium]|nr:NAD-dependent epimerase/dehydratase family protein [Gammaproteobacteria bacterium]